MGIFTKKTEVINFRDFMDGSFREKERLAKEEKQTAMFMAGIPVSMLLSTDHASAAVDITGKIMTAFNPVVELVQGISYPVALIMLSGGMLLIMMGQKHRGLSLIKWAAIGYIGMQFVPALMEILVDIGKAMRAG
jgi:hypothetical protein